jgi:hypothetical protein
MGGPARLLVPRVEACQADLQAVEGEGLADQDHALRHGEPAKLAGRQHPAEDGDIGDGNGGGNQVRRCVADDATEQTGAFHAERSRPCAADAVTSR